MFPILKEAGVGWGDSCRAASNALRAIAYSTEDDEPGARDARRDSPRESEICISGTTVEIKSNSNMIIHFVTTKLPLLF